MMPSSSASREPTAVEALISRSRQEPVCRPGTGPITNAEVGWRTPKRASSDLSKVMVLAGRRETTVGIQTNDAPSARAGPRNLVLRLHEAEPPCRLTASSRRLAEALTICT